MREFLLVVPDLMLAGESPCAGAERGLASLRFGASERLVGGWRAWLSQRLGRAELEGLAIAAVVATLLPAESPAAPCGGRVGQASGGGGPWLATPLHFVAGLETLHLPRDGILSLGADECLELAAGFADTLGADQLALLPVARDTFVLRGLDLPEVATVEPSACLGADLACAQPTGPGATTLRRLMTEIEMWLHDHPLNLRRAERGLRPVRSLWLWGGAAVARSAADPVALTAVARDWSRSTEAGFAPTPATGPRPGRVYSDDAWVRAACGLAGIGLAAYGASHDVAADGEPRTVLATARFNTTESADREAFERRHLAAAVAALATGRLGRLTVVAADRIVTVTANDRYRFWRAQRPWLMALGG